MSKGDTEKLYGYGKFLLRRIADLNLLLTAADTRDQSSPIKLTFLGSSPDIH